VGFEGERVWSLSKVLTSVSPYWMAVVNTHWTGVHCVARHAPPHSRDLTRARQTTQQTQKVLGRAARLAGYEAGQSFAEHGL